MLTMCVNGCRYNTRSWGLQVKGWRSGWRDKWALSSSPGHSSIQGLWMWIRIGIFVSVSGPLFFLSNKLSDMRFTYWQRSRMSARKN